MELDINSSLITLPDVKQCVWYARRNEPHRCFQILSTFDEGGGVKYGAHPSSSDRGRESSHIGRPMALTELSDTSLTRVQRELGVKRQPDHVTFETAGKRVKFSDVTYVTTIRDQPP
jgi:hypothetical protein